MAVRCQPRQDDAVRVWVNVPGGVQGLADPVLQKTLDWAERSGLLDPTVLFRDATERSHDQACEFGMRLGRCPNKPPLWTLPLYEEGAALPGCALPQRLEAISKFAQCQLEAKGSHMTVSIFS